MSKSKLLKIVLFTFAIILIVITLKCTPVIISLYREASPGTRVPYITLNLTDLVKYQLLSWGWEEEGFVFDTLDSVSETAYQKGIAALPEGDGEKYIWYYLRHFYYYPDIQFYSSKKFEQIHKKEILTLTTKLANAPIANQFMDKYRRYDALSTMLASYAVYLQNHHNELLDVQLYLNLSVFADAFYKSLLTLMNVPLWSQNHTNYFLGGVGMSMVLIIITPNKCDNLGVRVYNFIKNNKKEILLKIPPKELRKWGGDLMQTTLGKKVDQLLTQQCHYRR